MTKEQHELLLKQLEALAPDEIGILIEERVKTLKQSMTTLSRNDAYKLIISERKKELYFKSKARSEGQELSCFIGLQALERLETEFWFNDDIPA